MLCLTFTQFHTRPAELMYKVYSKRSTYKLHIWCIIIIMLDSEFVFFSLIQGWNSHMESLLPSVWILIGCEKYLWTQNGKEPEISLIFMSLWLQCVYFTLTIVSQCGFVAEICDLLKKLGEKYSARLENTKVLCLHCFCFNLIIRIFREIMIPKCG